MLVVAITGTINAFFSMGIALALYFAFKQRPQKILANFIMFYFTFGVFYLFFATSQLIADGFLLESRAEFIAWGGIVGYFFLYVAMAYLAKVGLLLLEKKEQAVEVFWTITVFALFFIISRIIAFHESAYEEIGNFVYWRPVFPPILRVITGVFAVITTLFAAFVFIFQGWKNRDDKFVFYRALWLGGGVLLLFIASVVSFLSAPTAFFNKVVIATFLVLVALSVILRGVFYHPDADDNQEKKRLY